MFTTLYLKKIGGKKLTVRNYMTLIGTGFIDGTISVVTLFGLRKAITTVKKTKMRKELEKKIKENKTK